MDLAHTDAVVAIQDLGAAGLTSSVAECAGRVEGAGARIDVSRVPRREKGMTPYHVMLSESQERMLVVVQRGREPEVEAIFRAWDLTSAVIGEVTCLTAALFALPAVISLRDRRRTASLPADAAEQGAA